MAQIKPINVAPVLGGKLQSSPQIPVEVVGLQNYRSKINFRRYQGKETVIPGWHFWPFTQPAQILNDPIVLVKDLVLPSRRHSIIAATKTRLFRFDEDTSAWVLIGSGFDPNAKNWEAEVVGGKIIFNNSSDLPVLYGGGKDSWDAWVTPLQELREIGVVKVGTIGVLGGYLMVGDLVEFTPEQRTSWMNGPTPYGRVTIPDTELTRTPYRRAWSHIGDPSRWFLAIDATMQSGDNFLFLDYPADSVKVGDKVEIANLDGESPTVLVFGTVTEIDQYDKRKIYLDATATGNINGFLIKGDYQQLTTGYVDRLEDGSHILSIQKLDKYAVIYRDGLIELAAVTADANNPIYFETVYDGKNNLHNPRLVINVNDAYHLFAGVDQFYSFSLTRRWPEPIEALDHIRDIYFPNGLQSKDSYGVFRADQQEVWIAMPSINQTIIMDTQTGVVSLVDYAHRCGDEVSKIGVAGGVGAATERWFLWGTQDGKILKDEKDLDGNFYWARIGQPYKASLLTGAIGDGGQEIHITTVSLNESIDESLKLKVFSSSNPARGFTLHDELGFTGDKEEPPNYFLHLLAPYVQLGLEVDVNGKAPPDYSGMVIEATRNMRPRF